MTLGIMQPYFMPYIGYWQLMAAVDTYVVYDDVNYIKGGWVSRNNILLNGERHLFTIALNGASPNKLFNEITIRDDFRKFFRMLESAYKKAPYYQPVMVLLECICNYPNRSLGEFMYEKLIERVNAFSDEELKKLVLHMYEQRKDVLLTWPAAYRLHHAVRGGLLMHTLSIVKLCEGVCEVYPFVNKDLLLTGAMLHDIAKTTEYDVGASGIASGYTVEGNLIGHLVKGAMLVDEAATELSISREKAMLVEHMLISHHGEPEYGAAVRPMFLEAELLSELDLMDARVYQIAHAIENVEENGFSSRLWALEDRRIYKHETKQDSTKVNLE